MQEKEGGGASVGLADLIEHNLTARGCTHTYAHKAAWVAALTFKKTSCTACAATKTVPST